MSVRTECFAFQYIDDDTGAEAVARWWTLDRLQYGIDVLDDNGARRPCSPWRIVRQRRSGEGKPWRTVEVVEASGMYA